jgi:WD40 repeat protein
LWVRVLGALTAEPLAGTEGASSPFWSPDSRSIAFVAQNTLKKVDVRGGPPVTLSPSAVEGRGSWSESGVILFSTDPVSLGQVSAANEGSSPAAPLDFGQGERVGLPFFLPDGRHFLCTVQHSSARTTEVYVGSLDARERGTRLLAEAAGAMYAQGHVLFQRGTTLMAQAFDADRLTLAGDAVPIAERLDVTSRIGQPGAFSVSRAGVLAYQTDGGDVRSQLVWRDRSGKQLRVLGDAIDQTSVALSPDDTRAAVSVLDSTRNTRDLWLYDVARGVREQFTFDPTDELLPVWSPDGDRIAYGSTQKGSVDIYQRNSTGVGAGEVLVEGPGNKYPSSWSRDGFLTYFNGISGSPRTLQDVWIVPVLGDHTPRVFIHTEAPDTYSQYSPDGRWLAYSSGESLKREIYVEPVPVPVRENNATAGGTAAVEPRLWSCSSSNDDEMVAVGWTAGLVSSSALPERCSLLTPENANPAPRPALSV